MVNTGYKGIHTPTGSRSKVWKYVFKYTKCLTTKVNVCDSVWEHQVI